MRVGTCPHDLRMGLATRSEAWPSGMDAIIEYVHSLGLKFGLYGDRGSKDCAGKPGADGHEVADAHFLAAHKVDWYKEDSQRGR